MAVRIFWPRVSLFLFIFLLFLLALVLLLTPLRNGGLDFSRGEVEQSEVGEDEMLLPPAPEPPFPESLRFLDDEPYAGNVIRSPADVSDRAKERERDRKRERKGRDKTRCALLLCLSVCLLLNRQ
jgi:hypothetical protein